METTRETAILHWEYTLYTQQRVQCNVLYAEELLWFVPGDPDHKIGT